MVRPKPTDGDVDVFISAGGTRYDSVLCQSRNATLTSFRTRTAWWGGSRGTPFLNTDASPTGVYHVLDNSPTILLLNRRMESKALHKRPLLAEKVNSPSVRTHL